MQYLTLLSILFPCLMGAALFVWKPTDRIIRNRYSITVVLITHHMDEAILADRVVVMNEGRVAMDGTPTEVFTRVEELEEMGLTVPDTVQLLHRLRAAGYEVPLDALDVEACADAVFGALN